MLHEGGGWAEQVGSRRGVFTRATGTRPRLWRGGLASPRAERGLFLLFGGIGAICSGISISGALLLGDLAILLALGDVVQLGQQRLSRTEHFRLQIERATICR